MTLTSLRRTVDHTSGGQLPVDDSQLKTLLYPYKSKGSDEELRYSLRSVCKNLPHRNVIIVGDRPKWLSDDPGVTHLAVTSVSNKHLDVRNKVYKSLHAPNLSDIFIYMNDDLFVMNPITKVSPYNRGTISEAIAEISDLGHKGGDYLLGMQMAQRISDGNSYELHIPMEFETYRLINLFNVLLPEYENVEVASFQFRTLYGNIYNIGGRTIHDVKVRSGQRDFPKGGTYLSTDNNSFANGAVGQYIRDAFPEACKYER